MKELDKVLDSNEKVLWEGKPKFRPFFLKSLAVASFGIIFLAVGGFVVFASGNILFLFLPHFWVGMLIVFGVPAYTALVYKNIHYAITDKRVLIQKGLVGRDFEMIDYDKITNAEVSVGLLDKIFGESGSILISTAGSFTYTRRGAVQRPYTLSHVSAPYEVFKFFKKVSHAVKTDIEYPNQYRPKENTGYNTSYKNQ